MSFEIYKKRLNRYGTTSAQRLEQGRRANFERFLKQSPHYTTFTYGNKLVECVFEPHQQNETKTIMHILCRVNEEFNVGDIVEICGDEYMFWYWDQRQDSGYNRWVVIQISQEIEWLNEDGTVHVNKAYIYGQENNMLKNELKSRSRQATLYLENIKLDFMIMPTDANLKINSYLSVEISGIKKFYRVTGFDHVSTPGIMYVSMDPTIERDLTPPPTKQPTDNPDDFFWFGGNNLEVNHG